MTEQNAALSWETEQQKLSAMYHDKQLSRLTHAVHHARQLQGTSHQISEHFSSWITLLNHAYDRLDLYSIALELITVLHQPVTNSGYTAEWELQVRFAIRICSVLGYRIPQAEFKSRLSNILYWTGRFDEARHCGDEALKLARQANDPKTLCVCATTLIGALVTNREISLAESIWRSTLTDPLIQEATGATKAWAMAHLSIYGAQVRRAQLGALGLEEAVSLANQAAHWLKGYPGIDPDLDAQISRNRGLYYWLTNRYTKAAMFLQRARSLFKQQNNVFNQHMVEGTLALVYWSSANLVKAEVYAYRSARAAKQLNGRWQLTRVTGTRVLIALFRGRLIEARRFADRHVQFAEELGVPQEIARARCNRGVVMLHQGEIETALVEIDFDRQFLEGNQPNSEGLVPTYVNLARCYFSLHEHFKAGQAIEKALELAQASNLTNLKVISLRGQAELLQTESVESSTQLLMEALKLANATNRRMDIAGCLLSLASLTGRATYWDEGEALLCQMGAAEWLYDAEGEHTIDRPPRLPAIT